jgi:hypothetical protein
MAKATTFLRFCFAIIEMGYAKSKSGKNSPANGSLRRSSDWIVRGTKWRVNRSAVNREGKTVNNFCVESVMTPEKL